MNLEKEDDTNIRQETHGFGNYDHSQPKVFAIKMFFQSYDANGPIKVELNVAFVFIEG